jgi:hypothetical protein
MTEEPNSCFHCGGDLKPSVSKEMDYTCIRCRRGWKRVGDEWHSRATTELAVYGLDGRLIDADRLRRKRND